MGCHSYLSASPFLYNVVEALVKKSHKGEGKMDETAQTQLKNLWTDDRVRQNQAYNYILEATDKSVNWAYEVWDELLANLSHKDNHNRAIAAQILSNLAKSDPKNRILKDFDKLLAVTKDERFVTARHCLQSLWKVGVAGNKQNKARAIRTYFIAPGAS